MTDNVNIGGNIVATDESSLDGSQVQLFKQAVSADGDRTLVPATASTGLLVDVVRVRTLVSGTMAIADGTNPSLEATVDSSGMLHVRMAPIIKTPIAATLAQSSITISGTAGNIINPVLTPTPTSLGATHAMISIEGSSNSIRWWDDGKTPTGAQGMLLPGGDYMWIENLSNFKVITATGSTSSTVSATLAYYKYI